MSLEIKFCPTCNNILNITKNPPKNKQIGQIDDVGVGTPDTVSDSANENKIVDKIVDNVIDNVVDDAKKIDQIILKLSNDQNVTENEMIDFKLEQFIKNKIYQKLDKKTKPIVQAKLIAFYEKIEDSTSAYYHCVICSYTKPIESGMLVASRTNYGDTKIYLNTDKLKNKVNNSILPYTRNYICINKNCISHTDHTKREAVMYRIGNSIQVWYTCCECKNSWKGE